MQNPPPDRDAAPPYGAPQPASPPMVVTNEGPSGRDDATWERPSGVTTASLILSMLGVLSVILGALFFLIGNSAANLNPTGVDPATAAQVGGGVAASGIFWIVFGAIQIGAGILSWNGRQSGRILGLFASVIGILIAGVTLLGIAASESIPVVAGIVNPVTKTTGAVSGVVLALAYVLCLGALTINAGWFRGGRVRAT